MRLTANWSVWAVLKTQGRSLAGEVMLMPAAQEISGSLAGWVMGMIAMEVGVRLGPIMAMTLSLSINLVALRRALLASPSSS